MKQNCTSELNMALYQELNFALRELLMLWFTVGFLNLERITWNSPCDLVQKVYHTEDSSFMIVCISNLIFFFTFSS